MMENLNMKWNTCPLADPNSRALSHAR